MNAEQQYIDLYEQARDVIFAHSIGEMNTVRDQAFEDFRRLGFPSRKVERYKYTDMQKLFEPDYGLNLNRLQIPVDPYKAFRCDVPNLSTSLYFMVNDMFYRGYGGTEALPVGEDRRGWRDGAEHPAGAGRSVGLCAYERKGGTGHTSN